MRPRCNRRPSGILVFKIIRLCLEMTRSEVKINGVCLNIFRSETRGVDAPFFELANKRIRNVALAVIHAVGFNRTVVKLYLTLFDRDIDTAQVWAILIRPENRLRPRIADAVRLVEVVRSRGAHIVIDMVEVRRAVGVVLHRPCVGNHVRLAAHDVSTRCILPHDLDVLAVVGRLDICALIGLRRIRRFRIQRSVCVKVTRVIRRRRRAVHERRQERQCPPLIDAPLRPGRTGVVDGVAPCSIVLRSITIYCIGYRVIFTSYFPCIFVCYKSVCDIRGRI